MKSVSVAHPQSEGVMNVCLSQTAGRSQKQPLEVPSNFLLVSNHKITTTWASFPGYTRYLGISADHATCNSKNFIPVVFPATP